MSSWGLAYVIGNVIIQRIIRKGIAFPRDILMRHIIRLFIFCTAVSCFSAGFSLAQQMDGEKLPMYGQPGIVRPEYLKKVDEGFVRDATLKFGNRLAASRAIAAQGWEAVRNRNPVLAMQRFNQAWLLNPKNYQAFWGFGAVLSEQKKLAEAIEQLDTARELVDDTSQMTPLLTDVGTVHSEYAASLPKDKQLERAHHFVVANQCFADGLDRDPNFAAGWREWAISLYRQERYSEAWLRAQRAKELNAEPFPPEFIRDLQIKMPNPK